MCDIGKNDTATSSGVSTTTLDAPSTLLTMLRCDSITPFGRPVVPEV